MSIFKKSILNIQKSYVVKRLEISNFQIRNLQTHLLIETIDIRKVISEIPEGKIPFSYEEFEKVNNETKTQKRTYEKINNELVCKLHFQFFEECLAETIYSCFASFPKYLNNAENRNDIPYEKVFDQASTIDDIQDYVITDKVKKIVQSNNIVDVIAKMEKLFSFKFKITKVELDALYLSSLYRNILTHNNGIINEVFLTQLKLRKLNIKARKGDNILDNIRYIIVTNQKNQDIIVEKISEAIINDENRLIKHHDSLI